MNPRCITAKETQERDQKATLRLDHQRTDYCATRNRLHLMPKLTRIALPQKANSGRQFNSLNTAHRKLVIGGIYGGTLRNKLKNTF